MNKNLFYILIIMAMVFWGASWISTKVLTSYISAYELVFLRMGICFISMIPIAHFLKMPYKIDLKTFILVFIASMLLVLYSVFMFLGVDHGTGSFGGALVPTLIPIVTYILVAIITKKTISLKHSFALILGAFGVLSMLNVWNFEPQEIFSKYNIYFVTISFFWAIITIITAKVTKINTFVFTLYTYIISSLVIYIFYIDNSIFIRVVDYDFKFWFNIFVVTILSTTFGVSIYFLGAIKLGTKEVSSFVFLTPISAIFMGAVFLGEEVGINTIIGMIFAMIAIYILNNFQFLKGFLKLFKKTL